MAIALTHLRSLLGEEWVEAEVVRNKHSHRLGLWQQNDPDNLWLKYTEDLLEQVLANRNITLKRETLAAKLKSKNDFVPTLAEMESALFLAQQGFAVTVEPSAPETGPDIQADWQGALYFVEIRTVGLPEQESRRDAITEEISAKLKKKPSSYWVQLTVGRQYKRGTQQLNDAVKALFTSLDALNGVKEAKLYFAGKNDGVLVMPGADLNEKHRDIMKRADFIAEFHHAGRVLAETPASFFEPMKHPPEPSKDHERLRQILDDKRDQLPKGSRGIIVLEVSNAFMLSEFSIDTALYGDRMISFAPVGGPSEPVGETIESRNRRGFLLHTSRVSAVVIQKRKVEEGKVMNDWYVYPTNRLDSDTIRLSLEELQRFGNVGDRTHLSAENVPE
jgi:hypothetical protein